MNAAGRWDPERQRRALRLMGIEPLSFRAALPAPAARATPAPQPVPVASSANAGPAAPARARLRIAGLSEIARADALLGGIVRSLGLSARHLVFGEARPGVDLPALAFGPGHVDLPTLPGLAALRADPRAKRTAWQAVLRPLAGRMRKS